MSFRLRPQDQHLYGQQAIQFWVQERQGIRLSAALRGDFEGLVEPSCEVMNSDSTKVGYKFEVRPLR